RVPHFFPGRKPQPGETAHPAGPGVARRGGARTPRGSSPPAPPAGAAAPPARPKVGWQSSSWHLLLTTPKLPALSSPRKHCTAINQERTSQRNDKAQPSVIGGNRLF